MRRYLLSLLLLFALSGTLLAKDAACSSSPQAVKEAAAIAQHGYARWIAATQARDSQADADLYTEDAVVLPPGQAPVMGKAAILAFYKKFNAEPATLVDETFTPLALLLCGDTIIDVSEFTGYVEVPGKGRIAFHGKNMVVWKKDREGVWKLQRDMWSDIREPAAK
jgi:uncharacterized protein (TIGR02246 family)